MIVMTSKSTSALHTMLEKPTANIHKKLANDTKEESSKITLNCPMWEEMLRSC